MDRIRAIIKKEWREVFKNRFVLFTVAFLPMMMTALPLVILYFTGILLCKFIASWGRDYSSQYTR